MKSTFGEHIQISLFGESHGAAIGVNINGLAPGIKLDLDLIRAQLNKRKPKGKISTQRQEADEFEIVSGFFNGYTTGTPLCIFIRMKPPNTLCVRPMPIIQHLKNMVVFKITAAAVTFQEELRLLLLRQAPFVCKF